MVELKRPNIQGGIRTGFDKNLQDYKKDIPQLFYYNLFVLISDGIETRIGSFNAPWEHFFEWKRLDEKREAELSLEIASRGLCAKEKLLDYLENFVLYHKKSKKIIAKNHQFLGVNATVEALKKSENGGKLGTFWHTQGSGKSYSMIFFTKKVEQKLKGNWSFLILTDRNDLDEQIFKNFLDTGTFKLGRSEKSEKNQYQAKGEQSRKQLAEALGKNKRYYFSTIFNFGIEKGNEKSWLKMRLFIIMFMAWQSRGMNGIFVLKSRRV